MERSRHGRGAFLTTLGVLVALAVVALAARGGVPEGEPGTRRVSDGVLDALFSLFLLSLAVSFVLVVAAFVLGRNALRATDALAERRRNSRLTILMVFLFLVAAAFLVRRFAGTEGTLEPDALDGIPLPGDPPAATQSPDAIVYEPEFAWLPVLIVCGLAAAAVAAAWLSAKARRKARGEEREPSLAEALDDVLAETLDDLRSESDPRRAVIAAYARLERVFGAYGLPRRPSEAPVEFLERVLAGAEVSPAAARRLTRLFEQARFSQHDVGPEMKEDAIEALETVRHDLAAAELRAQEARDEALARAATAARERAAAAR